MKKGYNKNEGMDIEKDLSKMMCFPCHKMEHYSNQYPLKKKGNRIKQVVFGTTIGVEEDPSQIDTVFSMTSCLSSNTMYSVGWYVDSGVEINMKRYYLEYFRRKREA
jgi:hypothetical protein